MGFFARLLRKERPKSTSKGPEEASPAETQTDYPKADDLKAGSEAKVTESAAETEVEAAKDSADTEAGVFDAGAAAEVAQSAEDTVSAAEAVEIPEQHSAAKAADSKVGEGAP
jgi:hypothetical protein